MNVSLKWGGSYLVGSALLFAGCSSGDTASDSPPAAEGKSAEESSHHHNEHGNPAGDHHEEGSHQHGGDHSAMQARVDKLSSYGAAIRHIEQLRQEIAQLIASNKLADVHPPAEEISLAARRLPELASKSDIPRESWKDINVQSRDLANLFTDIDAAADRGKKAETEAAFEKMEKLIEKLKSFDMAN